MTPARAREVTVIVPGRGWMPIDLAELWRSWELLYFLVWRDIKVRYKQTLLGVTWAVLQPVLTMLLFTLVFSRLARIPSEGVPYPLFSFAALVPWQLFANGLTQAANSLVASANLVRKVYFPRLLIPMASVVAGLVDFAVALGVLIVLMLFYGQPPTGRAAWLPVFVLLAFAASLGVGLWLAALNAQFRDVRYVIPFLTQVWLFITPIAYPSRLVPPAWQPLYALNPMVGVVEGCRWALLGTPAPAASLIATSAATTLLLLVGGAYYFRRLERDVADVL
ncbi:MAG TPA: ABC transporter permease [Thermoanaerobaculia bacterium]|jgi:lipopolysaccharide transport system permease protein|nr:ABC transporter permease [Thermoanaerobaculia bacterium]